MFLLYKLPKTFELHICQIIFMPSLCYETDQLSALYIPRSFLISTYLIKDYFLLVKANIFPNLINCTGIISKS